MFRAFALSVVGLALSPSFAGAADLTVKITNIEMEQNASRGKVYLCLYPATVRANADFPSCEIQGVKKVIVSDVAGGNGSYKFAGLSDGQYALSAFQDVNGMISSENGKLDTVLGIPIERVGTYKPIRRKPKFDDISFAVPSSQAVQLDLIKF